jgi:hypothetical protein
MVTVASDSGRTGTVSATIIPTLLFKTIRFFPNN